MKAVFDIRKDPGKAQGQGQEGASKEEGGSFRIVAIGPLLPPAGGALGASGIKGTTVMHRGELDAAMAAMAPGLTVDVSDPRSPGGRPMRLEVRFSKVGDFRPATIAQRVPEIAAMKHQAPVPVVAAPADKSADKGAGGGGGGGSLIDLILDAAPSRATAPTPKGAPPSLLQSILANPDVRRLEAAWRGLKLLVDRLPGGATVEAFAAMPDEVETVLATLVEGGGEAIDLVVIDHELGASARDLALLSAWAEQAADIGAPTIVNASPVVLGFDNLDNLSKTKRRVRSSDDPRALALCSVAAKDATRWIALAMNGPLARARITAEDGPFEEDRELVAGPGYAVAILAAESFARTGWGCQLTGAVHGVVGDLPVGHVPGSDRAAIATDSLVRDDAAAEAASAGVCVLTSAPNRDVALLPYAPTLFRGPIGPSGTSAPAQGTLADQFFVGRLSWAITQLAAAIPAGTAEKAIKEVAELTLAELFGGAGRGPQVTVKIAPGDSPRLQVTVRPKGFLGVGLEEATLAARLG